MSKRKPKGYWTKEKCQEEALKYNTKSEFRENSNGAYGKIKRNGWLDELCSHMIRLIREPWSYEECKKEALKYNSRWEFQSGSKGAYKRALRNGWLDEICSHMDKKHL